MYDNSSRNQVSAGLLYAGVNAALVPELSFLAFDGEIDGEKRSRLSYTLTIPAGESRSLLSFTALDLPANSAAVEARLRAIAADPVSAVPGLSAQERARVVNFRLEP